MIGARRPHSSAAADFRAPRKRMGTGTPPYGAAPRPVVAGTASRPNLPFSREWGPIAPELGPIREELEPIQGELEPIRGELVSGRAELGSGRVERVSGRRGWVSGLRGLSSAPEGLGSGRAGLVSESRERVSGPGEREPTRAASGPGPPERVMCDDRPLPAPAGRHSGVVVLFGAVKDYCRRPPENRCPARESRYAAPTPPRKVRRRSR